MMRYKNEFKRDRTIITLFLCATLFLTACGGKSQRVFDMSDGIEWRENDICAVVFIGYGNDFTSITQTDDYIRFCERFPSLRELTRFAAETEGDEIYYIIPRFSDATIIVNEYKIDIEDNMNEIIGAKLYDGEDAPILIKCNLSELHPNTTVMVTGRGKSLIFSPISGFVERNDMQFISSENDFSDTSIRAGFSSEYNYKGVYAGIYAGLNYGKVSISFDREEAAYIFGGMDFMLEDSYNVEGINGLCKGVFIGDVGQDYNPVLCCIMEDGGIEVLALYDALRNYDFRTSGRLLGYDNVVSVSNEGVQFGEGGGYITLFTLDASGNKKEVDFNVLLNGEWIYQTQGENGEERYIVFLSMDWKISYISGFVDAEANEIFLGTCWIIEENEKVIVYEYEMKEPDRSEMTGEAPDLTIRKGTFKVEQITDDWFDGIKVTCLTGLKFHPGGIGKEAPFVNKLKVKNEGRS
jgi:hypothetical protein